MELVGGGEGGDFVGGGRDFVESGAFVDFVEHRAVEHVATGAEGIVKLMPIKAAAVARNLIEGRAAKVVGRVAGEFDGEIIDVVAGAIREVSDDNGFEAIKLGLRAVPANRAVVVDNGAACVSFGAKYLDTSDPK